MLDSGAEGPGFKSVATLSGNSLRQSVHTHCASVHQAAKLIAALLRVAGVTAGLAKSNGRLGNRVWATFTRILRFCARRILHRIGWPVQN